MASDISFAGQQDYPKLRANWDGEIALRHCQWRIAHRYTEKSFTSEVYLRINAQLAIDDWQ
ncbi:MAG: hypothetical protein ACREBD_12420 [Blastocatellia bacterium]